MCEALPMVT